MRRELEFSVLAIENYEGEPASIKVHVPTATRAVRVQKLYASWRGEDVTPFGNDDSDHIPQVVRDRETDQKKIARAADELLAKRQALESMSSNEIRHHVFAKADEDEAAQVDERKQKGDLAGGFYVSGKHIAPFLEAFGKDMRQVTYTDREHLEPKEKAIQFLWDEIQVGILVDEAQEAYEKQHRS